MSEIHIESTVAIATGTPATFDKAGYEALTWVFVNGMVEAPSFGTTHADIAIPSLATGRTAIRKGASTGQNSSLAFSEVSADPGQAAVLAASLAATGEYSLRLIDADVAVAEYCSGIIKDYLPNKPTTSSYTGASANFVPNYDPLVTTPA